MNEEMLQRTDQPTGSAANPDPATTGPGVLVAGPAARSRAEGVDPKAEDAYWRAHYATRPYVDRDTGYDTYQMAYQTGYEGHGQHPGKKFEEVEPDLQRDYEKSKGNSTLTWDKARSATRDAWNRVELSRPGESDDFRNTNNNEQRT